jgi:hypothetical protein
LLLLMLELPRELELISRVPALVPRLPLPEPTSRVPALVLPLRKSLPPLMSRVPALALPALKSLVPELVRPR